MSVLETINLRNNSLTQEIPGFLGTFPKLTALNLADNNFSGTIPSTLLNNGNLKLETSGNPNLCTNTSTICNTESQVPFPRTGSSDTRPSNIPSRNNGNSSKASGKPVLILLTMFFSLFLL
ncbi:hypothetical protein MKW92_036345 [Papaver armeniacum]|nr:hypothetical protein MKW92_036345 [Papaver armeniacum]